jgi:predicted RNA-binding protein YlqC (UPF0109 family)
MAQDKTEDLVLLMVRSIVDTPGAVKLKSVSDGVATTFTVQVAEAEVGQVIGKSGRTARALRTLLSSISIKRNQRFTLDILMNGNYQDTGEIE